MYSINSLIRVEAGRQGETGLRKVVIDCSAWTQSYPDLSIALVAIRPGETEPYVPTGATLSDGILTWIPDAVDTAIAGTGLLGIQGTDASEHVIKSAKTTYVVESAVDTPQGYVPSEPEESWLAHAEAVLQDMLDRLAAQSAGTITDWLEENITQETGYVIDTSLTVQNAAADAKAAGAVRDNLDADIDIHTPQLVIPCYDMADTADGSVVDGMVSKRGRILYVNGEYPGVNWRINVHGRLAATNGSPSSVRVPDWYSHGTCDSFVPGHTYSYNIVVLSGTAPEFPTEVNSSIYIVGRVRTEEGDKYAITIRNGQSAECTYAPEAVVITLPAGTYNNAKLYLRIVDETAAGRVTDVQVNGSSVVSGGVANIAMPTTSQWELIREETVINATEADIVISADSNGQAFELTDVRLVFITPQQDTAAAKADYGRVRFYYQAGAYDITFIGAYTQAAGAAAKVSYISYEQRDGMLTKSAMPNTSRGGMGPWQTYATEDGEGCFVLPDTPRLYNRVNITKVTGTAHYYLYGKRK